MSDLCHSLKVISLFLRSAFCTIMPYTALMKLYSNRNSYAVFPKVCSRPFKVKIGISEEVQKDTEIDLWGTLGYISPGSSITFLNYEERYTVFATVSEYCKA